MDRLADSLSLTLAGILAYQLRTSSLFPVDPYLRNPSQYWLLLATALLLWHILLGVRGGTRSALPLFRIDELQLQFTTSLWLVVLLITATFLYHQYDYSRLVLAFGWLFFVLLGGLGRQLSYRFREFLHRRGYGRRRVLLAGDGGKRALFLARIREHPGLGLDLLEAASDDDETAILGREWVDELFLFTDRLRYEEIWKLREGAKNRRLTVHLVPSFGNLYLRRVSGGFFDGMVLISLDSPHGKRLTHALKRLFDIVTAGLFLLVLLPLLAALGLLIKLDSPGPVLFRQTRVGRKGQPFTILKFRTMFAEAETYAETPTERSDPRITRLGGFLRSTGLDELPQLWNVLVGEMSLVGPRPEMPFIVERYGELERQRLRVRPGITGLWQVYARTSLLPIHDHIEYDLYYLENLSLSLDLMILLDTIPTMILRTGI